MKYLFGIVGFILGVIVSAVFLNQVIEDEDFSDWVGELLP